MQSLVLPPYAGCGDNVTGAAKRDEGDVPMDEDSVRRREELARSALLYAGTELLDYSEEEEAEGESSKDENEDVEGEKSSQYGGSKESEGEKEEGRARTERKEEGGSQTGQ